MADDAQVDGLVIEAFLTKVGIRPICLPFEFDRRARSRPRLALSGERAFSLGEHAEREEPAMTCSAQCVTVGSWTSRDGQEGQASVALLPLRPVPSWWVVTRRSRRMLSWYRAARSSGSGVTGSSPA